MESRTAAAREIPPPANETELLRRAKHGDKRAFDDLMFHQRDKIIGIARKYGVPRDDCQDLAQKVLIRAWRGLPRFEERCTLSSWIYTITRRCCHDYRQPHDVVQPWRDTPSAATDDPLNRLIDRLDAQAAAAALDQDPRLRIIVTMLDLGHPVAEIAATIHMSIPSTYRLTEKARSVAIAALEGAQEQAS